MSTLTIRLEYRGFFVGPSSDGYEGWIAVSDTHLSGKLAVGHTLIGDFSGSSHHPDVSIRQTRETITVTMQRWFDTRASMLSFLRSIGYTGSL